MSQDLRSAFRIPMPDGQKNATLRIGGRKFEVQLLDASATGVALACPLHVTLDIEDRCELHTASGGGMICIVRKEVFADGILIGAIRTGDLGDQRRGMLGLAKDLVALPAQVLSSCNLPTRIGLIGFAAVLVVVAFAGILSWQHSTKPKEQVTIPTTPVKEEGPTPDEVQEALRTLEATLPQARPETSESDLRAIRIFEQQKQLLEPAISRRLRLTPTQENRIRRALNKVEGVADDTTSPDFWEAIRQAEMQILNILTPTQVRMWRTQSGAKT